MRYFLAMDCDGTVSSGIPPGPIPIEVVRRLNVHPQVKLMVIGDSRLQVQEGFDGVRVDGKPIPGFHYGKSKVLKEWREQWPGFDYYIVVDDAPEQYVSGWEGWLFVRPDIFAALRWDIIAP